MLQKDLVHLDSEDGFPAVADLATLQGAPIPVAGDQVSCCVCDIEFEGEGTLIVSLNPKLAINQDKPSSKKSKKAFQKSVSKEMVFHS